MLHCFDLQVPKINRPKHLPKSASKIMSGEYVDVKLSDESEGHVSCISNNYDYSPFAWKTTHAKAWIDITLRNKYNFKGVSIVWWCKAYADEMHAEVEMDFRNAEKQFVRVDMPEEEVFHRGTQDRSTTARINTKLASKRLRLYLLNGHVDTIFRRFQFGIRHLLLWGDIRHDISTTSELGKEDKIPTEVKRVEVDQPGSSVLTKTDKSMQLCTWSDILNYPFRKKITAICPAIQKKAVQNAKRDEKNRYEVRMGDTMMPMTYCVTPRRRKHQLLMRRKSDSTVLSRKSWGDPPRKEAIAKKPVESSQRMPVSDRDNMQSSGSQFAGLRPESRECVNRPYSVESMRPTTGSTLPQTPDVNNRLKSRPPPPGTPVNGNELPQGSVQYKSSEGRSYYYDTLSNTNETTWTKPTREEVLPSGWVAHENLDGQMYYHKTGTKEVTWTRPGGNDRSINEVEMLRRQAEIGGGN